jgi:hypothetical protein
MFVYMGPLSDMSANQGGNHLADSVHSAMLFIMLRKEFLKLSSCHMVELYGHVSLRANELV